MSATIHLFEAVLGDVTELSREHELVHTQGNCGTLEPRWWVVDVGVRARVIDTTGAAIPRPGPAEFRDSELASAAPLHLRIEAGIRDGRTGSDRNWLIDASSTRAYLFASTIAIYLIGPSSLMPYKEVGALSHKAARTVFAQLRAGLWPCDSLRLPGVPGEVARGNNCTIRVRVPAGSTDVAVPIPAGARTLAIFDSSASSSPWTWQLGEGAGDRAGRIAVFDGQTVGAALIPNFTHVAPAAPLAVERDVLLVFGVDL